MVNTVEYWKRNAVLAVYIRISKPHNADFWNHYPQGMNGRGVALTFASWRLVDFSEGNFPADSV